MIGEALKGIGLDFPGWLALFLQLVGQGKKPAEAAKEVAAQRLPNMFGIGRADEQLFEAIRQLVPTTPINKRHFIDLVTGKMKDYEENIFRLTVAGMPCGKELTDKPVKNPAKGAPATSKETVSWEFVPGKDLRGKYLEDIADEVSHHIAARKTEKEAAALVVKGMRSRRLITRSPAAQKAYELWVETTKWVKIEILDFFGVESFDKITPDMVAALINKLANEVPTRPEINKNSGFWRYTIDHNPIIAGILIVGTIVLAVAFYAIA